MHRSTLLPYVAVIAFSIVLVQALMFGFDTSGMRGSFIAAAIAFGLLGFVVGTIWSPNPLIGCFLASIPAWLFIFALQQWSVTRTLTRTVEGVPVILEPLSVSVFYFAGGWIGSMLFKFRRRHD